MASYKQAPSATIYCSHPYSKRNQIRTILLHHRRRASSIELRHRIMPRHARKDTDLTRAVQLIKHLNTTFRNQFETPIEDILRVHASKSRFNIYASHKRQIILQTSCHIIDIILARFDNFIACLCLRKCMCVHACVCSTFLSLSEICRLNHGCDPWIDLTLVLAT